MHRIAIAALAACGSPSPSPRVAAVPAPTIDALTVADGKEIFGQYCESCHTVDGTPRVGPTMKSYYGRSFKQLDGTDVTGSYDRLFIALGAPEPLVGYPPSMECCMGSMLGKARTMALIEFIKTLQ